MTEELPLATIRTLRRRSWAWLLPGLALLLAIVLGAMAWRARGPEVVLYARQGHGVRPGDVLSYRGIAVGEVARVSLSADLDRVEMRLRLDPKAERLARAGSRFWVVRPDIALDRLRGIETLLGGRHLAVLPGAADAPAQYEFECLDEEPVLAGYDDDGLEFVLEAPRRFGLAPGAPITYRGIEVGSVTGVGLASDAGSVDVRCFVRSDYRELVRVDSVFWEDGGFQLDFELLSGLSVDFESLRSLVVGGIALATPTRPGSPAQTGARYRLAAEPQEEWLTWSPSLPVGTSLLPRGTPAPRLLRARLAWEEGFFSRGKSKSGWVLPLASGILAPEDVLAAPEGADAVALELRGERLPLPADVDARANGLARRGLAWPEVVKWPAERIRVLERPEDCLALGEPGEAATALDAARLVADGTRWRVDPRISFDESWHGAVVLARSDGFLVGMLAIEDGRGVVLSVVEDVR